MRSIARWESRRGGWNEHNEPRHVDALERSLVYGRLWSQIFHGIDEIVQVRPPVLEVKKYHGCLFELYNKTRGMHAGPATFLVGHSPLEQGGKPEKEGMRIYRAETHNQK